MSDLPQSTDLELEKCMDDDRAWFASHPRRCYRIRPAWGCEFREHAMVGMPWPVAPGNLVNLTLVEGLAPGVRYRRFLVGPPQLVNADEATARRIAEARR